MTRASAARVRSGGRFAGKGAKRWPSQRGMAERAWRAILNEIPGRADASGKGRGKGIPEENELHT